MTLAGLVVLGAPAEATHVGCGAVITQNTTLDSDIGPCSGDGLVVTASNILLDLNGRRIFGSNGAGDNAGIRLRNVTGVTVRNGTVQGFDAGIHIVGGSGNVVQGVTVRDNINDGLAPPCLLGDGIAVENSDNNRLDGNNVIHNGPFGGISLVGDSDSNQVRGNRVLDNNIVGGRGGCGNPQQDEGIRIEGPGAKNNAVLGNTVQRSLLAGIGVHGNVGCDRSDPEVVALANTDNIVNGNNISFTSGTDIAAGINVLAQGPLGSIVCSAYRNTFNGNTSTDNQAEGIFLASTSTDNTVNGNRVLNNGTDGIRLEGPIFRNEFTNVGPTVLDLVSPDRPPFTEGNNADFRVMSGSGSGAVTARVVPIDINFTDAGGINTNPVDTSTSGCEQADYDAAGFRPGDIALIQRGTCTFVAKVALAIRNGASAVIMFNEGQTGRTTANFGSVGPVDIPVLSTTYAVGVQLVRLSQSGPVTIRVVTNTTNVEQFVNVGAENNTLLRNVGQGNAEHDGHDENPSCDNNRWQQNQFVTVNQPCVASGGTGTVPADG